MTYLVVTVDVEEDFEWGVDFRREYSEKETSNVKELLKFQDLCDKYAVKPTYLVDYPVLNNKTSSKILKKLKHRNCELGTHLHAWCNPPFEEEISVKNTFANNLGIELVKRKMDALDSKFSKTFGIKPKTFKSGRYGINKGILLVLSDKGYIADTSTVPFRNQSQHEKGIDNKTTHPYYLSSKKGRLVEIPATSGFNLKNFNFCSRKNLLVRIFKKTGLIRRTKLSPEDYSLNEMRKICDMFVSKNIPVLHMELHSTDLQVGKNPNVKNRKDLEMFYEKTEGIIDYIVNKKKCIPVSCAEFAGRFKQADKS